nr:hypothetical protein [uncultured Actinoplanes sp.]
MTGRVEQDAEGRAGLVRVPGRAESEHRASAQPGRLSAGQSSIAPENTARAAGSGQSMTMLGKRAMAMRAMVGAVAPR